MARNAEKAMTALARWRKMKLEEERGPVAKRPALASECNDLRRAERWRMDVIREIARKIAQIQNPGLGEFKIRDLNDEINKLLKTKYHWEVRICELGGPDYKRIAPRMLDREGREVLGSRGYKYFGAAKELPGVRELFEKPDQEEAARGKKSQIPRRLDAHYYGYLDEDDGVVLAEEEAQEKLALQQALVDWDEQRESAFDTFNQDDDVVSADVELQSFSGDYLCSEETHADVEGVKSSAKSSYEKFIAPLDVPSQKDVEGAILAKKKLELLEKYASEALLQKCMEARTLMGIEGGQSSNVQL